jgi:hypothetical protein
MLDFFKKKKEVNYGQYHDLFIKVMDDFCSNAKSYEVSSYSESATYYNKKVGSSTIEIIDWRPLYRDIDIRICSDFEQKIILKEKDTNFSRLSSTLDNLPNKHTVNIEKLSKSFKKLQKSKSKKK